MKLKKLFSAKKNVCTIIAGFSALLFFSCTSVSLSVPVPGQGAAKTRNIYAEYYNLGDSYFKLESYDKAAEYYELAMRKKDQYWAAFYQLAKCYVFQSKWNEALPMYKKLLERDSENASLKASLAYIYAMQGDFKNASKIYEALLEEQPKNQDYLENYLALLASQEKKFEKKYSLKFLNAYDSLKEEYPDNKNLKVLEDKYKELMKIKDELVAEELSEPETSDSDSEIESETSESESNVN